MRHTIRQFILDLTISRKLKLAILLTSSVALLLMALMLGIYQARLLRQGLEVRLTSQAGILAENSNAAVDMVDKNDALVVLSALRSDPDIASGWIVTVVTNIGILAHYQRSVSDNLPMPELKNAPRKLYLLPGYLVVFHPIKSNREVTGYVCLLADMKPLRKHVERFATMALLIMGLAIGSAFMLATRLEKYISAPIEALSKVMYRIINEKSYSLRVNKQSNDEMGQLQEEFNLMLEEIQVRDQALQSARDDLEKRVEIRTAELQNEISERKLVEEELRQSEQRFVQMFQASPIAICVSTIEHGCLLEVNEEFLELTEYQREQVVGRTSFELGLWEDPTQRELLRQEILQRHRVRGMPVTFRSRTGKQLKTLVFCEVIEWIKEPCLLFIPYDITEQTRLENQLRHAQKMEAVGQLAAGVAHDFNNILTIIQGNASLALIEDDLNENITESLNQISDAADRAAALTRQLLTFSRKQIMQPKPLSINEVLTNLVKMLNRIIGENVKIHYHLSEPISQIHADVGMVEQVVTNLSVNARDAMPGGGDLFIQTVEVQIDPVYVAQHPKAQVGHFVKLKVTDTGCGMDDQVLSHIFEPFFTTKEVGKGTGLGLATVYGIVELHRGWIQVSSQVGKGTSFSVFFPSITADKNSSVAVKDTSPIRGGHETILLVEDEPAVRSVARHILTQYGYQVIEAISGKAALGMWEHHKNEVNLLLTDMVMPDKVTGRQLADQLQQQSPGLKIIYMSGYSFDIVGRDMNESDGRIFISKPFGPEELVRVVRRCLDATPVKPLPVAS